MTLRGALSIVLLSCAGMFCGGLLIRFWPALVPTASAQNPTLTTKRVEIVDPQGRTRILMAFADASSPAIWFFDDKGRSRLNLGLYADGNAMVVLNDENQQAVEILRTVGPKAAPVLVMKSQGADRMILGLNERSLDPYFVYDDKGTMRSLFGNRQ